MNRRQNALLLTTDLGEVPIWEYEDNVTFAWHTHPENGWAVTHVQTGIEFARCKNENAARQLANALVSIDEIDWRVGAFSDLFHLSRIDSVKALVSYWAGKT